MSILLLCIQAPRLDLQVLRGYVGDRSSQPVWGGRVAFDILGTGYQRPFELATLRLNHMVNILPRCRLLHGHYVELCVACIPLYTYLRATTS